MKKTPFQSFTLIPIIFSGQLVGLLLLLSKEKNKITESHLATLNSVAPLLERFLKTINDDFISAIDNVIKEKFTALQPAVQWRFNEAAYKYLEGKKNDDKVEIDQIQFVDVYPLYGDIDVRESTLKRNKALQKDTVCNLEYLLKFFGSINPQIRNSQFIAIENSVLKWRENIHQSISYEDEYYLLQFIKNNVIPLLKELQEKGNANTKQLIKTYFKASQPQGEFSIYRKQLEDGLQLLNRTIRKNLDRMDKKIQNIYPSYFEKFRTDGV